MNPNFVNILYVCSGERGEESGNTRRGGRRDEGVGPTEASTTLRARSKLRMQRPARRAPFHEHGITQLLEMVQKQQLDHQCVGADCRRLWIRREAATPKPFGRSESFFCLIGTKAGRGNACMLWILPEVVATSAKSHGESAVSWLVMDWGIRLVKWDRPLIKRRKTNLPLWMEGWIWLVLQILIREYWIL
jgi:hypothetical protein